MYAPDCSDFFLRFRLLETGIGLLGSAAVGAAAPEAAAALRHLSGTSEPASWWNPINWVYGAADGLAGTVGVTPVALGGAGAYVGGRMAQKSQDRVTEGLKGDLDTTINKAKIPGAGPSVLGDVGAIEGEIKAHQKMMPGKVNAGRLGGGAAGATLGLVIDHYLNKL
jgi:hypothetical protein